MLFFPFLLQQSSPAPAPPAGPPAAPAGGLTDLASRLQQVDLAGLPWGAYVIPLGVLIAGLVLWISGRKVLKPITVVVFGLIGATIGYVIVGPMPAAAGIAPVWAWTLGFSAIGLIIGSLVFRFAMGLGLGLTLAAAGVLIAAVVTGPPANPPANDPATTALTSMTDPIARLQAEGLALRDRLIVRLNQAKLLATTDASGQPAKAPDALAPGAPTTPPDQTDAARRFVNDAQDHAAAFAQALWEEGKGAWNMRSPTQRLAMLVAAGVGFIVGTWLGVGVPKWAAGAVTALAGAALWLSAGAWLVTSAGLPGAQRVEAFTAGQWLVIWGAVAVLGMALQWSGLTHRKKRKPVPAAP
jgi:hypothetical protein